MGSAPADHHQTNKMTQQWFYSGTVMDKERRKQEIKRMFALADKDKDGKLSVAEWEQMLIQAGAPADKKEVESFLLKETGILMGDSHLRNFSERKHKLRNYSDSWIKIRMASSQKRSL